MVGLASGVTGRTVSMMSAALQTALTPTPHLAVLHQQRLYILSALQRTHIIIDSARARLNAIDNALSGNKRQSSTTVPSRLSQSHCSHRPSRPSSSTLSSDPCDTAPRAPADRTADDQPHDIASPNQEQRNRLSRATKKKLQHSRWRARGTLRNCTAEERALLESLRTVQDQILQLQDLALRDSTSLLTMPGPMAQTDFGTNPWMSGWAVEFGEKTAPLGCGFGPGDCAPGMAAPNGAMCPAVDGDAKQNSNNPRADTWMRDSGMPQNGNTMPIFNPQLMPFDHTAVNPQLQINTAFNQGQFAAQLQAAYAQQFIYSPVITSPLLLDSETTAEDLYDWQNGDEAGDPYGCVDPSSTQYNADPYSSFSYSTGGSFSYPEPIASPIEPAQSSTQNSGEPCRSPFPESWDLATALRVGRSPPADEGSPKIDGVIANGSGTPGRPAPRRRHVRQLSALTSPRGSRVYHIDDLVPDHQQPRPRSGAGPGPCEDRSAAAGGTAADRRGSVVVQSAEVGRDMGFGGWLEKPQWADQVAEEEEEEQQHEQEQQGGDGRHQTTVNNSNNNDNKWKGKGKALDPTSPTFVPGAGFFALRAPAVNAAPAAAAAAAAAPDDDRIDMSSFTFPPRPAPAAPQQAAVDPNVAPDSGLSSFSSTGVDSAIDQTSPSAVAAAAAAAENKRRYSNGYSSAAVDLLLNRFRENAANPIKKRRSWRKNLNLNVNGGRGTTAAMAGKMTVMGAVGEEEMGAGHGPGPAVGLGLGIV
ncbi:uncharacterized protein BKCO1_1000493 [Diplodia corticola]|uniref:Uncharacterized protein n=1 Tax=Diplodia corticola TaxID=236234 RepID=A0A1J9RJX5_9PEZI|nr:uncharacterized protein BKCO1_1000493 [Diplodia corticola]OJD40298.1 hypothetical protein BKCO1_1000493 [Diplodia corticola]